MAPNSLPQEPHAGQIATDSLSSPWEIQRAINQLNRELHEAEVQMVYYYDRQKAIKCELAELMIRRADAYDANRLRRDGAGAVAEAERMVGGE